MHPSSELTIGGIHVRAVDVPVQRPLETSGGALGTAPLVLIDLHTEEGVIGSSYGCCYTPVALKPIAQLLSSLAPAIEGDLLAPLAIQRKLQESFRLLGAQGLMGMAVAGIDMAAWDALAKAWEALGTIRAERAAEEARELLAPGFSALKVRLGYPDLETDIEVVRAIRRSVGEDAVLMSDYNQSLSRSWRRVGAPPRWTARASTG